MPQFRYRVVTHTGEIVVGEVDASSHEEVVRRIEYLGHLTTDAEIAATGILSIIDPTDVAMARVGAASGKLEAVLRAIVEDRTHRELMADRINSVIRYPLFLIGTAAVITGRERQVSIDGEQRVLVGDGGDVVAVPRDVVLDILGIDALWSGRQPVVRFYPDGASTGAVLKLSREKAEYEIRVSWYTGGVAIAL